MYLYKDTSFLVIYGGYYHGRCWTEIVLQKEIFLFRSNIILAKKIQCHFDWYVPQLSQLISRPGKFDMNCTLSNHLLDWLLFAEIYAS